MYKNFISNEKIIVSACFISLFLIGLNVFDDFGIHWDSDIQRVIGKKYFEYIVNFFGDYTLGNFEWVLTYGPVIELPLFVSEMAFEKIFGPISYREVFLLRHFLCFLIYFLALICFYYSSKLLFMNWKLSLLGSFFLVLSPKLFTEIFVNSKDLTLMSFYIIGIYTFIISLRDFSYKKIILHALVCALVVDIRIVGVFLPFFSVLWFLMVHFKKSISKILLFAITTGFFVIIFWPKLWMINPLEGFIHAFKVMSQFKVWSGEVLFNGKIISGSHLPFYYIPVWIVISTPFAYVFFFVFGIGRLIKNFTQKKYSYEFYVLSFLLTSFLVPIISVVALNSVLYDGWRHLYFLYPIFILLSVFGWQTIRNLINNRNFKYVFYLATLLVMSTNIFKIYQLHPFQNIYFSPVLYKNLYEVKYKYELDYWGLSYYKGLEYILQNDTSSKIKVYADLEYPIRNDIKFLNRNDKFRLYTEKNLAEANYFIGTYRSRKNDYDFKEEFFSLEIDNTKIISVYKL